MSGAPAAIQDVRFTDLVHAPDLPGPDAVFSEHNLRGDNCQYMIRTPQYSISTTTVRQTNSITYLGDPEENFNQATDPNQTTLCSDKRAQLFDWFDPKGNHFRGTINDAALSVVNP